MEELGWAEVEEPGWAAVAELGWVEVEEPGWAEMEVLGCADGSVGALSEEGPVVEVPGAPCEPASTRPSAQLQTSMQRALIYRVGMRRIS